MYRIKPRCHNRRLKRKTNSDRKFFILLPDQTCLIGSEFQVMKLWKRRYKHQSIQDMFHTNKRVNSGVTSLSKFIDFDPRNCE